MSVSFPQPSLEMYRPVTNFPEQLHQEVRHSIADNLGIALGKFTLNTDLRAHIFTPGQIWSLYGYSGTDISRSSLDYLAEHLNDNMPESVDKPIAVASFPTEIHKYKHTKRSSDIALASLNPTVVLERRAYERLSYTFLQPELVPDFEKIIANRQDHVAQVHYVRARTRDQSLLEDINVFLQSSDLIPPVLTLGPATIDDVTKMMTLQQKDY